MRILTPSLLALMAVQSACGSGVITSEDVTPTQSIVIVGIIVASVLYALYTGGKGR